jgi:7-keto-8-aminopelargonate synthetase-like enzyme
MRAFKKPNNRRTIPQPWLTFSGCDYFRLTRDQRILASATLALRSDGLNVSASRATTGEREIYLRLEARLAAFFGSESALILPDGYLAPIAAAQALADEHTHALIDESAHGALLDAARMLNCPILKFPHRNPVALRKIATRPGRRARLVVLTDGMFSRDGSVAPLREYLKILPRSVKILVDDAHGAGVLGQAGKGSLEHWGVPRERIIQCITLSKAFGAFGGAVLCSGDFRARMVSRSRVFSGTTPLPPPLAGAALKAVEISSKNPARRRRIHANTEYLREQLRDAGWKIATQPGPIVCLPILPELEATRLKKSLLAAGIYPPFVNYYRDAPGGVFRFVVSSEHTRRQLKLLAKALKEFKQARDGLAAA